MCNRVLSHVIMECASTILYRIRGHYSWDRPCIEIFDLFAHRRQNRIHLWHLRGCGPLQQEKYASSRPLSDHNTP